jgi:glycosyltransferase involved in cell wall biosynthesis
MKILFFITSLAGGGAEKVLVNMVNHMDKTKYHITVITLFDTGVNRQSLCDEVVYKYVFKKVIRGNSKLLQLFSPEFLYRHMIKDEYDIIVSYFQGPTTRIIAGCPNKKIRLVQWIHNEFHTKEKVAGCYRSIRECIELQQRFDAAVYVAESVKDIYLHTFPEINTRNNVLYNVVESEKIRALSEEAVEEKNLFDAEFTLVGVGRFVPQKAFDRLVSIVAALKQDGFYIKLLLLGTGQLEGALRRQSKELKVENEIVFLGYQQNPYKYVKNADLFVCPSLHEGFSTAVTESLIVGTPVVTTRCSGMEELLGENEFGLIVENSEEALYRGVKNLLGSKGNLQYYREKAAERGDRFETGETVNSIERFFDSL